MRTRLLTSGIGLILVVLFLFFHDTFIFDIGVIAVNLIAVYETIINTKKVRNWPIIILAAVYTVLVNLVVVGYIPVGQAVLHTVYVAILFLVSILQNRSVSLDSLIYAFAMPFLLGQAFSSFAVVSHAQNGLFLLMYAFACAWICDSGAYFVERALGKHKLAPTISPKKTVEGAIGGLISSEIFCVILALVCPLIFKSVSGVSLFWVAVLTPFLAVSGILGDLMASYIKRSVGIKDFGNLLPGHGGIMDRFDSLLLIVPMISVAMELLIK